MARTHSEETKRKISDSLKARNRLKGETRIRKKLTDGFERGSGGKKVALVQNQAQTSISYMAELEERNKTRQESVAEINDKDISRRRKNRDYGLATQNPVSSDS